MVSYLHHSYYSYLIILAYNWYFGWYFGRSQTPSLDRWSFLKFPVISSENCRATKAVTPAALTPWQLLHRRPVSTCWSSMAGLGVFLKFSLQKNPAKSSPRSILIVFAFQSYSTSGIGLGWLGAEFQESRSRRNCGTCSRIHLQLGSFLQMR